MFAHYAENLQGLALVYTLGINATSPKKITYDEESPEGLKEGLKDDEYIKLIKGEFVDFFCSKSKNWKYENEYRFFPTPGLQTGSSIGLTLKGLFYTDRFDNEAEAPKLKLLRSINEKYYENSLFIQRLIRSYQEEKFLAYRQENGEPKKYEVLEYLRTLS